jgi:hypothetical protein
MNAITLLLKEVLSIRFDQNLPQGEKWPEQNTEYDRRQNTTEHRRRQKKKSKSEEKSLVYVVRSYEVL